MILSVAMHPMYSGVPRSAAGGMGSAASHAPDEGERTLREPEY